MSNVSAKEYAGWINHIGRFPPGDFYTQHLLADILCVLISFMSGKKVNKYDVAPHLQPPEERIERQREQERQAKIDQAELVKSAYEKFKGSGKELKIDNDA